MVPFIALPGVWEGAVTTLLGGGEFSFAIGLIVAGGVYLLGLLRIIDRYQMRDDDDRASHSGRMAQPVT